MRRLMPDLPGLSEDVQPPDDAIDAYVARLRELTRNTSTFRLVMLENAGYGFRRNLFGLKPFGVSLAIASAITAGVSIAVDHGHGAHVVALAVVLLFDLLSALIWITVVSSTWIRTQGFTYGRTLLNAAETLAS